MPIDAAWAEGFPDSRPAVTGKTLDQFLTHLDRFDKTFSADQILDVIFSFLTLLDLGVLLDQPQLPADFVAAGMIGEPFQQALGGG